MIYIYPSVITLFIVCVKGMTFIVVIVVEGHLKFPNKLFKIVLEERIEGI